MLRETAKAMIAYYTSELELAGDVLEVGGYTLNQCAIEHFPAPRFTFHSLDLDARDIPNTIVADITDCAAQIPDNSFDLVWSSDVFEHIDRPWLAAAEISRILRPGGLAFIHTVWSWRNHPCPIDYWRFSPECLQFLFSDLTCVEKGYDLSARRTNMMGFWASGKDSVPLDVFGGFRENWAVYLVASKGAVPDIVPFRDSDAPLAHHLRQGTQGSVTNPRMLGQPMSEDPLAVASRLDRVEAALADVRAALAKHDQTTNAARRDLDRRIIGMGQPLPVRAYRKLRRTTARAKVRQRASAGVSDRATR